jgi:hypothetical protein
MRGWRPDCFACTTLLLVALACAAAGAHIARADPRQLLGDLTLNEFCQAQGYDGVVQTRPRFGHAAAIGNWRCFSGDALHPFSMEQACEWQYEMQAVQAHFLDRDDAFSWRCFSLSA